MAKAKAKVRKGGTHKFPKAAVEEDKVIRVTCEAAALVPLDEFVPLQGDLKELDAPSKKALKNSIKKHGITFPFHAWKDVKGGKTWVMDAHQRRICLLEMIEEGYVIEGAGVPTAWIEAKDKREALSKLLAAASQYGKVNAKGLYDILTQAKVNIDEAMSTFRFPEIDMKKLRVEFFNNPDKDAMENEVPVDAPPVCQHGQVWLLGEHRLMCGDSTKAEDVKRLLDGETPLLMVTDPPYGVNYDATWREGLVADLGKPRAGKVSNDDRADWTPTWQLSQAQVAYVWHASAFTDVVMKSLKDADFDVRQMIIWNKDIAPVGRSAYHWKHEPCWYAVKNGKSGNWKGDRKQKTVWDGPSPTAIMGKKNEGDKEKTIHPTQKPLFVYEIPLNNHTETGDLMYDPFCGSGSAVIAAEKTGRRCAGMELDPKYCDVIIARWEKYSGKKAKLSK